MATVHRTRRRPFKVNTLDIVAAPVAWAFEFVFAWLPVRRATEMSAARKDDKQAVGSSVNPDAMRHLVFFVNADAVLSGEADVDYA